MSLEEVIAATVRVAVREEVRTAMRDALAEVKPSGEYMNVAEAARVADVSTKTIRAWIKDGKLPPHHAGREKRIRRDELARLLESPPAKDGRTSESVAKDVLARLRGG